MTDIVYIAGSGRSGSTLLERMLGQMASFVTIGELRHLWRGNYNVDLCGCGQPFAACPFWQPILAELFAGKETVDFKAMLALRNRVDRMRYLPYILSSRYPASYRQHLGQYTAIVCKVYQLISERCGDALIVDSSKDISTLYMLAKAPGIKVHVVHMVRDSRAVAFSRQRKRVNPQFVEKVEYLAVYTPRYAAWDWLYRNTLVECGKPLYDSYQLVRYEDLVEAPAATVAKLCAALGVASPDLGFIRDTHIDVSHPAHTVSGNPMRFHAGPLPLKLDAAWTQEMRRNEQWIVTGLTWPLLKRYGYPLF